MLHIVSGDGKRRSATLSIPLVKRTIATIRAQRLEAGAMDANAATRVTIVMA